jgi:hypothetical protein
MELIDVALKHPQIKLVVSALGVASRDMTSCTPRAGKSAPWSAMSGTR